MKYFILLFTLFSIVSVAMELDSDLDGVSDKFDKCPNTPFDKLVEKDGCSREYKLFISTGIGSSHNTYTNDNRYDSKTSHLDLRYIKNNFSVATSFSYYMQSEYKNDINDTVNLSYDKELADTYIALEYNQYLQNFKETFLTYKINLKVPTASKKVGTGNIDYGADVTVTKYIDRVSYYSTFGFMTYSDTDQTKYKDIKALSLGIGYILSNKLFTSLTYTNQNSNLEEEGDIKRYSGFIYYDISDLFYTNISYSYGKSDTTIYNNTLVMFGTSF